MNSRFRITNHRKARINNVDPTRALVRRYFIAADECLFPLIVGAGFGVELTDSFDSFVTQQ